MKKNVLRVLSMALIFALLLLAVGCTSSSQPAENPGEVVEEDPADTYPRKPITLAVGFNPGGDTDLLARAMADGISKELGTSVVVSNQPGAGGSIAAAYVKDSDPDGYTLCFCHNPIPANYVCGLTDYSIEAFEVACIVAKNDAIYLTLNPDKYPTLDDYLTYVKEHPGETTFGAVFGGSYQPMTMGVIDELGLDVNLVDIGGAANGNIEVAAGRVDAVFCSYAGCKDYLENGDLYPALVLSAERRPEYPDVPTLVEMGGSAAASMQYGFYFPKGTPESIINKFDDAAKKVCESQEFKDLCAKYAAEPDFHPYGEAFEVMKAIEDFYMPYKEILAGN
ncbi:MAG: tripartite tricarboxylate transporter substrate binding protein [Firmicutes bacterium]|nr:tripartite tricarboxylate transporter substrate binding protein [Bacillota bacterium]